MSAFDILYLAYGSNLHPERLRRRVGTTELIDVVRLSDWRLCFDKRGGDGSAKANLRPAPGTGMHAWAALHALDAGQWRVLDRCEGLGHGYETLRFDVLVDGRIMPALAYLSPSQWTSDDMRPFDWYRDLIVAGARYLGVPEADVARIAATPSVTDPVNARAGERFRLLRELAR